jgi:hypothetical protein
MQTLEIIAMVYKSQTYTKFITDELINIVQPEGWELSVRIIANDPEDPYNLLEYPRLRGILTEIFRNEVPKEYYLNRVYRCWNHGGASSKADNVCFVNSDMAFSPGWLTALLRHHDGVNIPCSRLVESGKMPSGAHGLSRNCGRSPEDFDREAFLRCVDEIKEDKVASQGLFMPCIFEKARFLEAGMYPEGNIYWNGAGTCSGCVQMSGDQYFFNKLIEEFGMKHITVFDSVVYHVQEGEMHA